SATDLPDQAPAFARLFNTVDSYDTHALIPEYFEKVDKVSKENNHVNIISVGWDTGIFSINRVMVEAVLHEGKTYTFLVNVLYEGKTYTFWGKGLRQGQSDAVRRVEGVKAGVQYTLPSEESMNEVRRGENPELTKESSHKRECYVVLEDGADADVVEDAIKTMPNYFDKYDTTVYFITEEELERDHSKMPHGGFVIHSGQTGTDQTDQIIEYSLKLDSNPEFTAS